MGTRADFYVGRGADAEWIGSIAFDGYPDGIPPKLFDSKSEAAYRKRVAAFFDERDDVTRPADGWPWPWEDSLTSDYAYAFDGGRVWAHNCCWFNPKREPADDHKCKGQGTFPDMSKGAKVTFGRRSGLLVI
jgi:hypothetical protein